MAPTNEIPQIIREFLTYHETIKGHSKATVDEYFLDLRTFFRYLKYARGCVSKDMVITEITIADIDLAFIRTISLSEIYDYLLYLSREREKIQKGQVGLSASARARKIATLRSFFKYLTVKTKQLDENPLIGLDSPKILKTLPRHLTLEESIQLLKAVEGRNKIRDYCILCIFLNCGLRISEIVRLDLADIREGYLLVHGKGGKDRIVFLNDICKKALNDYLMIRKGSSLPNEPALFLSTRRQRIGRDAIHHMVKQNLKRAGLDSNQYSSHKLRHTAATLLLQNGVDIRTLQELLGHEHLNTTQIYTHIESTELRLAAEAHPLSQIDVTMHEKEEEKF